MAAAPSIDGDGAVYTPRPHGDVRVGKSERPGTTKDGAASVGSFARGAYLFLGSCLLGLVVLLRNQISAIEGGLWVRFSLFRIFEG